MSGEVVFVNQTKRHIQYRIDHQLVCVRAGRCRCKQGRRGVVASSIHVPGGIGMRSAPVDGDIVLLMKKVQEDLLGLKPKIKIAAAKPEVEPEIEDTKTDEPGTGDPDGDKSKADGKKTGSKAAPKGGSGRKGSKK